MTLRVFVGEPALTRMGPRVTSGSRATGSCHALFPDRRSQIGGAAVKDRIREIDKEYGFNLSEDEIESIAKQAEETHRLLQDLYKVDVAGVMPIMKIDKQRKS